MALMRSFKELVLSRLATDPAFATALLREEIESICVSRKVEDLDAETLRAIANSRMSPEHDHLNSLLDD